MNKLLFHTKISSSRKNAKIFSIFNFDELPFHNISSHFRKFIDNLLLIIFRIAPFYIYLLQWWLNDPNESFWALLVSRFTLFFLLSHNSPLLLSLFNNYALKPLCTLSQVLRRGVIIFWYNFQLECTHFNQNCWHAFISPILSENLILLKRIFSIIILFFSSIYF